MYKNNKSNLLYVPARCPCYPQSPRFDVCFSFLYSPFYNLDSNKFSKSLKSTILLITQLKKMKKKLKRKDHKTMRHLWNTKRHHFFIWAYNNVSMTLHSKVLAHTSLWYETRCFGHFDQAWPISGDRIWPKLLKGTSTNPGWPVSSQFRISWFFTDFPWIFPWSKIDACPISLCTLRILKPVGTGPPGSQKPVAQPKFRWPNVFSHKS